MRIACCGCRRPKNIVNQDDTTQQFSRKFEENIESENDNFKRSVLNNGQLQSERLSLPDVVLPANLVNPKYKNEQRSSIQIDFETGRRPTLDVETTARLAVAESIHLDDPEKLRRPFTGNNYHGNNNSLKLPSPGNGNIEYHSTIPADNTRTVSVRKQSSRKSLISMKSLKHQLTPKRMSKSTGKGSNEDANDFQPSVNDNDYEDSADKLGQLPSSDHKNRNRFDDLDWFRSNNRPLELSSQSHFSLSSVRTSGRCSSNIRRGSLCLFSHVDEPIVTPFAQILASLRRVRSNFIQLTNISSSKDSRFGKSNLPTSEETPNVISQQGDDHNKINASETLEELEWCLDRLEKIQTHRSVSDMATSKFRKMLNKELSQFTDGCRNAKQISEYICSTFLDSNELETGTEHTQTNESISNEKFPRDFLRIQGSATKPTDARFGAIESNRSTSSFASTSEGRVSTDAIEHGSSNAQLGQRPTTEESTFSAEQTFDLIPPSIRTENATKLKDFIFSGLDRWGVDIFELNRLTPNPLTCLFYAIFQKRGLIQRFNIPEISLIRYINLVEEKYNDVPYHNRVHAADVLQSTHVLLNAPALVSVFTDLEVLAVLFACAIHDVDHPGLTNQYLINTNDELAIFYNDTSVLENHHLAVGFQLLNSPGCDMLENLPKKQRLSLRRMVIDMVLATDMSKHMSLLADLKTMVETKKVAGSGILTLDNYSDRMQILQNMIHCADLSNPTKPLELYRQWNSRVMEEHFRQGDRERSRGLELSPMCDRTTASIEKTQVSFIDYIVHPLWETWSDLVHPDALKILDTLDENREWYLNQIVQESTRCEPDHLEEKQ